MRRLFVFAMVMSLVLGACGGDSGEGGENEPDQPDATQPTSRDADSTDTPPATSGRDDETDSDGAEGSGPSTATVTIGDETYEFSSEGAEGAECVPDSFGTMSVRLPQVDGPGNIQIFAFHEEAPIGQPNRVQVSAGGRNWLADSVDSTIARIPELEGKSQVDSVEVDGNTVQGTARFVGTSSVFYADSEVATGTFEATCGEVLTP